MAQRLQGAELSDKDRKAYEAAGAVIVGKLKTLKLNNNRIEALVDQLYAINRRLVALEGRLLRLADSYGISRPEFLKAYYGSELDPNWNEKVREANAKIESFKKIHPGQIPTPVIGVLMASHVAGPLLRMENERLKAEVKRLSLRARQRVANTPGAGAGAGKTTTTAQKQGPAQIPTPDEFFASKSRR